MSNSLLEKIKSDAQAEVAVIEKAAAERADAYEAETTAAVATLETEAKDRLKKQKAHLETVALSKARQTGSIAIQQAKREGVDDIFEAVFAEISEAEEQAYVQYFTELGKSVLPEKASGTVMAPKSRQSETEAILKALHVDGKLTSSHSIKAGFILDTKEGAFDVTLDRVFAEARPRLEVELLKQVSK